MNFLKMGGETFLQVELICNFTFRTRWAISRNERGLRCKKVAHRQFTDSPISRMHKTLVPKKHTHNCWPILLYFREEMSKIQISSAASVTRLSDLLDFGQLFKACGNTYFAQMSLILCQFM